MLNHLDPESFTTRAIQFFQAALNDNEDSDLEADTDLGPKITKENIVIKENKPANEVTIQLSLIKKKRHFLGAWSWISTFYSIESKFIDYYENTSSSS